MGIVLDSDISSQMEKEHGWYNTNNKLGPQWRGMVEVILIQAQKIGK